MSYELIVKEEAKEDVRFAYDWYESKIEGLGERFLSAIDICFNHITVNPFLFEVKIKDIRYGFVDTFPYVVVYRIEDRLVIIYAIFGTYKDVKSWKTRV